MSHPDPKIAAEMETAWAEHAAQEALQDDSPRDWHVDAIHGISRATRDAYEMDSWIAFCGTPSEDGRAR